MHLPAIIVEYINAYTTIDLVRLPNGTYTIDAQNGVVTVYPGNNIRFDELFILMPPGLVFTYNPDPNTPLWIRIQPPWTDYDWEGYIGNHPNRPGQQ